jgi:hypothetical protein
MNIFARGRQAESLGLGDGQQTQMLRQPNGRVVPHCGANGKGWMAHPSVQAEGFTDISV